MTQQAITWPQIIDNLGNEFNTIASSHQAVIWAQECEFAKQLIESNPMLAQCQRHTVESSIKNVASVGLSLNPIHGYAHLVPESKKYGDQYLKDCFLRISYKGLIKLATDSGAIKKVHAEIVRENDTFIFNGVFNEPKHVITTPFNETLRGNPIGVYCLAVDNEGGFITDMMSWNEVLKIKSKAKIQNVWNEWLEEMAKKTILKRASKQWPKSNRLETAVSILNESEGSIEFAEVAQDLKHKFDTVLNEGTPIEFYSFIKSISEDDYNSLYNSGEKNKKGELKAAFTTKEKQGIEHINQLINSYFSDDDEIKENAAEIMNSLKDSEKTIIRQIIKARGLKQ